MPRRNSKAVICQRMAEALDKKEEAMRLFKEADAILMGLLDVAVPGQAYKLADGRQAVIRDNFAKSNTAWKSVAARRFELDVVK